MSDNKKIFSSINFSLLLSGICFIITYVYAVMSAIYETMPLVCIFLSSVFIVGGSIYFYAKYPPFIHVLKNKPISKENYDKEYSQNISVIRKYIAIVSHSERSPFASLFSGCKISLYTKGRTNSFLWFLEHPKMVHRVMDLMLIPVLLLPSYLVIFLSRTVNMGSWGLCFIALFFVYFSFAKSFLSPYSLSITVDNKYGKKVNIIFPFGKLRWNSCRIFGKADILHNTILISEDAFRLDHDIYEYIVAHENGHIEDNTTSLIIIIKLLSPLLYILLPHIVMYYKLNAALSFISVLSCFAYIVFFAYNVNKRLEKNADISAVESIGKASCIKALSSIKDGESKSLSPIERIFLRIVSTEEKIRMVEEYVKNKTL